MHTIAVVDPFPLGSPVWWVPLEELLAFNFLHLVFTFEEGGKTVVI